MWNPFVRVDRQKDPGCDACTLLDTKLLSGDDPILFRNARARCGRFTENRICDRCGTRAQQRLEVEIEGPDAVRVRRSAPASA